MNRPAPDALLIAQHVHRWPEKDEHVYLYRMPSAGAYRDKMEKHRYEAPGGIAFTDTRTNVVAVFGDTDMVKMQLVFTPDDEVAEMAQPFLGRDVSEKEWCEAREWLEQEEENEQAGT